MSCIFFTHHLLLRVSRKVFVQASIRFCVLYHAGVRIGVQSCRAAAASTPAPAADRPGPGYLQLQARSSTPFPVFSPFVQSASILNCMCMAGRFSCLRGHLLLRASSNHHTRPILTTSTAITIFAAGENAHRLELRGSAGAGVLRVGTCCGGRPPPACA